MLIALLTMMLLGGGGGFQPFTKAQRAELKSMVEDDERRKAILEQMSNIEKTGDREIARIQEMARRWLKADRDYTVGPDDFDRVIEEVLLARASAQAQFLDALFAMRSHMSREEWEAVFAEEINR